MAGLSDSRVAVRAYEIWERQGRPHGRDREHWLQAVAELSVRATKAKPAKAVTAKPKAAAAKAAPAKASPAKMGNGRGKKA